MAGKSVFQGGMEEALENGKESPHSVHASGLIDREPCLLNYLHNRATQCKPHDMNVISLRVTIISSEPKQHTTEN